MKPITKIIIFLVIAFIIVIIITVASKNSVVAPSTDTTGTTSASHESINPNASPVASVSPTAGTTYTLADVAKHKTPTDCWTTVNGSVYNLTPFVNQHPGGVENITKICGIDGTSQFMAQHGSDRDPQRELATLKIGTLVK
jgi:cytochrome b involved in lipid metabolism